MRVADAGTRFRRIAAAGIFFQGGAAAIDTCTIVAALAHVLTGSAIAVGAAAAIARYGWLFPPGNRRPRLRTKGPTDSSISSGAACGSCAKTGASDCSSRRGGWNDLMGQRFDEGGVNGLIGIE